MQPRTPYPPPPLFLRAVHIAYGKYETGCLALWKIIIWDINLSSDEFFNLTSPCSFLGGGFKTGLAYCSHYASFQTQAYGQSWLAPPRTRYRCRLVPECTILGCFGLLVFQGVGTKPAHFHPEHFK